MFQHRKSCNSCWGLLAGLPSSLSIDPTVTRPLVLLGGRAFEVLYGEVGIEKSQGSPERYFIFDGNRFRFSTGGNRKLLELDMAMKLSSRH